MEEKKATTPRNPRAKKYKKSGKWKAFSVEMGMPEYESLTEHVEKHGFTRNGFIRDAIKLKMYLDEHPDEMPK